MGGGRTNLLEELGRVEAEPSNRNRRAEISRVHGELNRGYNKGGRVGLKHGGKPWGSGPKPGTIEFLQHHTQTPKRKGKAVGGAVKIGKRFLDFIKTGKHVDKSGVKINVPKAAERLTGKPHVDHGKRKRIKHLGRGKAEGGRIGKAAGGWTKVLPTGPRGGHPGFTKDRMHERWGGGEKGKPHSSKEGRIAAGERNMRRQRKRSMETIKKWMDSRPKKAGPGAPSRPKKTWPPKHSDLLRRFPKMPQPHKSPGDKPYIPNPRRKLPKPGEPNIVQPAATGGRIGFKKGTDKKWMQKVSASIKKRGTKGKCTPITKPGCTGRAKALAKTFKKIAAKNKKA